MNPTPLSEPLRGQPGDQVAGGLLRVSLRFAQIRLTQQFSNPKI